MLRLNLSLEPGGGGFGRRPFNIEETMDQDKHVAVLHDVARKIGKLRQDCSKQPSLQAVCEALADAERMLFEEIAKFKPIKLNDSSKSPKPSTQA